MAQDGRNDVSGMVNGRDDAIEKLNNDKTAGKGDIGAELVKMGPDKLAISF